MKWRGALPKKANSKQIDPLSDFFIEKVPPLPRGTIHTVQSVQNSVVWYIQGNVRMQCQNRRNRNNANIRENIESTRLCNVSVENVAPSSSYTILSDLLILYWPKPVPYKGDLLVLLPLLLLLLLLEPHSALSWPGSWYSRWPCLN